MDLKHLYKDEPIRHRVKSHPEPFQAVFSGDKAHEIRINDRGYVLGDRVRMYEWDPTTREFSGRFVDILITHLRFAVNGLKPEGEPFSYGLMPGYVVFDFIPINAGTVDRFSDRLQFQGE